MLCAVCLNNDFQVAAVAQVEGTTVCFDCVKVVVSGPGAPRWVRMSKRDVPQE